LKNAEPGIEIKLVELKESVAVKNGLCIAITVEGREINKVKVSKKVMMQVA